MYDRLKEKINKFLSDKTLGSCLTVQIEGSPKDFVQILLSTGQPPEIVFCSKCGRRQYQDAFYCHNCGYFLNLKGDLPTPKILEVNFHYPHSKHPSQFLMEKLSDIPAWQVISWEKASYATISIPIIDGDKLERLVDDIFISVQNTVPLLIGAIDIDYGF